MPRTTRALVGAIIELDGNIVSDDAAMAPFIATASELVTECCTGDNAPATEYSDDRLELIERWLAAHFYAMRDPRSASEGAGAVSVAYQSSVGMGFAASHYGQQVMRLDTNGGLARLDRNARDGTKRPRVTWLGTEA